MLYNILRDKANVLLTINTRGEYSLEITQEKRKKVFDLETRNASREIKKFINNDGITIEITDESRIGSEVTYTYVASGKNMFEKRTRG